jgi:hypothetical protein
MVAMAIAMLCGMPATAAGAASPGVVSGQVDSMVVSGGRISAEGWLASSNPDDRFVSISLHLDEIKVFDGSMERFDRPDVPAATGNAAWLRSGWRVQGGLPWRLRPGRHRLYARARLEDGRTADVPIKSSLATIDVKESSVRGIRGADLALACLAACAALLVFAFWRAEALALAARRVTGRTVPAALVFASALLAAFFALVALGITGSSIAAGTRSVPFIQTDGVALLGHPRVIRGDEWLLLSPLAIAQANHVPRFPVVNANLGEDGQNMLIVGMTGAPVLHPTAIAKPATWGFFFLDLRRALSWYWQFPVFACLFAMWGVVAVLTRAPWRESFVAALLFSMSCYAAAWSNWPAYAVFFACSAFLSLVGILQQGKTPFRLACGLALGLSSAGVFFMLYPPWQVSLGSLFLALTIGYVLRERAHVAIDRIALSAFALALAVPATLVAWWWHDAHPAIQAMLATIYPGQRHELTGGGMPLGELLRGFANFATLPQDNPRYTNQSESASFYYLFLPLVVATLRRRFDWVVAALSAAVVGILCFMLFGIPLWLAKATMWARVPPTRADLALGVGVLLLSVVVVLRDKAEDRSRRRSMLAAAAAIAWAAIVFVALRQLGPGLMEDLGSVRLALVLLATATAGYFLAMRDARPFLALALAASIATTWSFNPVSVAPNRVALEPQLAAVPRAGRVVSLDSNVPAMYLLAAGIGVANGGFYYPPRSMWSRLDPRGEKAPVWNRYQHLNFAAGAAEAPAYFRVEQSALDAVTVTLDPARFDFTRLGVDLVTSPSVHEPQLRTNVSLVFVSAGDGWSWFRVDRAH